MGEPTTIADLKAIVRERGYEIDYNDPDHLAIVLPSEYVISIAWGDLNYCTGKRGCELPFPGYEGSLKDDSTNAEIAVWTKDNPDFIQFEGWSTNCHGWTPIPEILEIIDYLAEVRFLPLRDGQCFGVGS